MSQNYQNWAEQEAGIFASKVIVKRAKDSDSRGLYAIEPIYPGERLLYIPARTLIHAELLRK
jgi:hypothetical protein